MYWCIRLFLTVQSFHFSLLKCMRFLFTDFSSLSKSFCMAAQTTTWCIGLSSQVCFFYELVCPITQVIAKQDWTHYQCLGLAASEWPPTELHGPDHNPSEPCQLSPVFSTLPRVLNYPAHVGICGWLTVPRCWVPTKANLLLPSSAG